MAVVTVPILMKCGKKRPTVKRRVVGPSIKESGDTTCVLLGTEVSALGTGAVNESERTGPDNPHQNVQDVTPSTPAKSKPSNTTPKGRTIPSTPEKSKPSNTTPKERTIPSAPAKSKPANTTPKERTIPSAPAKSKPANTTPKERTMPSTPKSNEQKTPIDAAKKEPKQTIPDSPNKANQQNNVRAKKSVPNSPATTKQQNNARKSKSKGVLQAFHLNLSKLKVKRKVKQKSTDAKESTKATSDSQENHAEIIEGTVL